MEKISRRPRQETLYDKLQRYRGAILMISVPVLLITLLFFLMPSRNPANSILSANRKIPPSPITGYAVIFDAGSSGSRVHVFHFDEQLNLIPIGKELELFEQKKPGLSSFAKDPKAAADSLLELLEKAEAVVPREMQQNTPVRVGATAGLRQLDGDTPDRILQAVRDLLKNRGTFKSKADWVTVLDGNQEGAYQWVTINYLLGNLGKEYASTVGVVDLGGGSVQMAYAISDADAAKAPKLSDGENTYVQKMYLKGRKYNLYVHSYLHYGLLAARAEILKVGESGNLCTLSGYSDTVFLCIGSELPLLQKPVTPVGEEIRSWISLSNLLRFFTQGSYKYGGAEYDASSASSGSSLSGCRDAAVKALKINEPACTHMKCTFGGVWNGGGGDGQNNLFVASFFFDRAAEAGFVDPSKPVAKVRPADFEDAAKIACQMKLTDAKSKYRGVHPDNLPYLCMDLVYEYTLLTDGFGLDPQQEMTLVKKVEYKNSLVEAAWPLGSAIEVMSLKT